MTTRKQFQAKQISDAQIRIAVRSLQLGGSAAGRWAIQSLFPQIPAKVVDAKLRAAVLKGILSGCGAARCAHGQGCRGDFRVVEKEEN